MDDFYNELKLLGKTKNEIKEKKNLEEESRINSSIVDIYELIPLIKRQVIEYAKNGNVVQTAKGKMVEFPIFAGHFKAYYSLKGDYSDLEFTYGRFNTDSPDNRYLFFDTSGKVVAGTDIANKVFAVTLGEREVYKGDKYYAIGKGTVKERFVTKFKSHDGFLHSYYTFQLKISDSEKRVFEEFKKNMQREKMDCEYVFELKKSDSFVFHKYSYSELGQGITLKDNLSSNDICREAVDFYGKIYYNILVSF